MLTVLTVLRSGGDYTPEHVHRLRDQLAEHAPGWPFICYTDMEVDCESVPLQHGWPGWWSKLEAFAHDSGGASLFLDLDSTVQHAPTRIAELAASCEWSILRDVYRAHGLQSSIVTWQDNALAPVLDEAIADFERVSSAHRGDQNWIETLSRDGRLSKPRIIQDAVPGAALSYKADGKRDGKPLHEAEVVFFHGRPRPWEVEQ